MRGAGRWFREIHVEGHLSTYEAEVFEFESMQWSEYTRTWIRKMEDPAMDGIEIRMRCYADLIVHSPPCFLPAV